MMLMLVMAKVLIHCLLREQMEKLLKDIDRKQRQDALKNAQEALL